MPPPERVTDPGDDRLADYVSLTDVALRRRLEPAGGLFIAESAQVVSRALAAGFAPRSLLLAADRVDQLAGLVAAVDAAGAPVLLAGREVLRAVAGYDVHRGVLAAMHRRPLPDIGEVLADARRVVVLEDINDHTNVGAVFRCAAALGMDAAVLSPRCADPLYRRAVRVSMGAVLTLPYARMTDWWDGLALLRAAGFATLALTPAPDAVPLDALPGGTPERCAVVFGAEGAGLSRRWLDTADLRVRIPMSGGIDSLNVAAAAAVACWAVTRPRPGAG